MDEQTALPDWLLYQIRETLLDAFERAKHDGERRLASQCLWDYRRICGVMHPRSTPK
jgi:hypothetical protein